MSEAEKKITLDEFFETWDAMTDGEIAEAFEKSAAESALDRMSPEVRAAFEESWKHNEPGLRCLADK